MCVQILPAYISLTSDLTQEAYVNAWLRKQESRDFPGSIHTLAVLPTISAMLSKTRNPPWFLNQSNLLSIKRLNAGWHCSTEIHGLYPFHIHHIQSAILEWIFSHINRPSLPGYFVGFVISSLSLSRLLRCCPADFPPLPSTLCLALVNSVSGWKHMSIGIAFMMGTVFLQLVYLTSDFQCLKCKTRWKHLIPS